MAPSSVRQLTGRLAVKGLPDGGAAGNASLAGGLAGEEIVGTTVVSVVSAGNASGGRQDSDGGLHDIGLSVFCSDPKGEFLFPNREGEKEELELSMTSVVEVFVTNAR